MNVEAESEDLRQRSLELSQLLDAGQPAVEGCAAVLAESKRLGALASQARRDAAAKVAAGRDPGCPVGHTPPIRRIRTDGRNRDLDPFHGKAVVTDQLLRYWEHRRDVVAPAVEGMYRAAATERPYRAALVSAVHGHMALLRERRSMLTEGGADLEASLRRYDDAYVNLRQGALDAQQIVIEAQTRLDSLKREAASTLGGGDNVKGFIASSIAQATDALLLDPDTSMPLEKVTR
jgi:hypothetical protein